VHDLTSGSTPHDPAPATRFLISMRPTVLGGGISEMDTRRGSLALRLAHSVRRSCDEHYDWPVVQGAASRYKESPGHHRDSRHGRAVGEDASRARARKISASLQRSSWKVSPEPGQYVKLKHHQGFKMIVNGVAGELPEQAST